MTVLTDAALDQLFRNARTHAKWLDKPVGEDMLQTLADLVKLCPTSANCAPARIVFVVTKEAKEKLKPCLAPGNVEKTMTAPVTAIIGYDTEFYEKLPFLFPFADARSWFAGNSVAIEETAFRNSSLQAGYLILAARSLGLDCGPMSGFDKAGVEAAFFPSGKVKANMLCNLGYGDVSALHPRAPRFAFEEFCKIV
jgi:3-hydroxypropanoate dehydrogenase